MLVYGTSVGKSRLKLILETSTFPKVAVDYSSCRVHIEWVFSFRLHSSIFSENIDQRSSVTKSTCQEFLENRFPFDGFPIIFFVINRGFFRSIFLLESFICLPFYLKILKDIVVVHVAVRHSPVD